MNKFFSILIFLICHQASFGMHPFFNAIEKGEYVDTRDNWGQTPLICAIALKRTDIIELLLANHADPNVTYRIGKASYSALQDALLFNRPPQPAIVKLLLDYHARWPVYPNGYTLLHAAAAKGLSDAVEYLLNRGADVNCQDYQQWTPLHSAANVGSVGVVKSLLAHRANHRLRTFGDSLTALEIAKRDSHKKAADLLERWPKLQCANARLALMMGIHPRAGATSNLNVLDQHLLRTIAEYIRPEDY